jgi:hypothetical protein
VSIKAIIMKSKVFIIIIFTLCIQANLKSQTPIDTLQWLKVNVEQKNYLFSGKPLNVLFDSLGNLKNALADYDPPMLTYPRPDTGFTTFIRLFFAPGGLEVSGEHLDSFFANLPEPNTHVPYIEITFASPVPFVTTWFDNDKERLGSIRWNRYLRNYWGQFIVDSVIVGEY